MSKIIKGGRRIEQLHQNISAGHFHIGTMTGLFMRKNKNKDGIKHYQRVEINGKTSVNILMFKDKRSRKRRIPKYEKECIQYFEDIKQKKKKKALNYLKYQQKKHFELFPKSVDCYKKKKKKMKMKIYQRHCPLFG